MLIFGKGIKLINFTQITTKIVYIIESHNNNWVFFIICLSEYPFDESY